MIATAPSIASLSPRQREVYEALYGYFALHGRAPKYEEACGLIGVASNQAVAEYVERFVRLGLVKRRKRSPRGLRFLVDPATLAGDQAPSAA